MVSVRSACVRGFPETHRPRTIPEICPKKAIPNVSPPPGDLGQNAIKPEPNHQLCLILVLCWTHRAKGGYVLGNDLNESKGNEAVGIQPSKSYQTYVVLPLGLVRSFSKAARQKSRNCQCSFINFVTSMTPPFFCISSMMTAREMDAASRAARGNASQRLGWTRGAECSRATSAGTPCSRMV